MKEKMSKIPGVKKLEKFKKELRGSFGRFKTDHSYQIYYLSTNVPVDEVNELSTASELFGTEKIEFEELIQRDIDQNRVRKIANEYLSKGQGRVVFFPPLLACVVLIDDSGHLKKQYSDVNYETLINSETDKTMRTTWDRDGFQLDLPEAEEDASEKKILWEGSEHYFYDFAATLRVNSKRAKLVVLDGQHRLEAIRLLMKNADQRKIIEGIEIPICVVWAPEAVASVESNENMMQDFRELFVRVNSEPQKVSGHFITLLKDDSYSAMTLRRLADYWKSLDSPGKWNRLHLLEWNTRENESIDKRTREFSLTTVSIVAKVLEDHLYKSGAAPDILRLEQSSAAFAAVDPEFSWDGVVDRAQKSKIDDIVKSHIDQFLVPALDILFRTPSPYMRLEHSLGEGFSRLHSKVTENNSSFIGLKALLNSYIYKEVEMHEDSAKAAYVDFKAWVGIDTNDRIYFLSAFQQGLLRFWLSVSAALKPIGIDAKVSALISVRALEKLVFSQKIRFLSSERKYTRRTLWKNENVNFSTTWAKTAWADLIGTSLIHKEVRSEILMALKNDYHVHTDQLGELDVELTRLGYQFGGNYGLRLRDELIKETRQALLDFFGDEKAAQLNALRASSNDSDRKEFEAAIKKKAESRFIDAMTELADQLEIKTADLIRNADVS